MNEITTPPIESASTSKKQTRTMIKFVVGVLLGLVVLIALNMK